MLLPHRKELFLPNHFSGYLRNSPTRIYILLPMYSRTHLRTIAKKENFLPNNPYLYTQL